MSPREVSAIAPFPPWACMVLRSAAELSTESAASGYLQQVRSPLVWNEGRSTLTACSASVFARRSGRAGDQDPRRPCRPTVGDRVLPQPATLQSTGLGCSYFAPRDTNPRSGPLTAPTRSRTTPTLRTTGARTALPPPAPGRGAGTATGRSPALAAKAAASPQQRSSSRTTASDPPTAKGGLEPDARADVKPGRRIPALVGTAPRQQRGPPRARRDGRGSRRSRRPAKSRMQGSRICPPLHAKQGRCSSALLSGETTCVASAVTPVRALTSRRARDWRVARQTSSTVARPAFVSARARGASAGVVTPFVPKGAVWRRPPVKPGETPRV